ncbi:MAG: MerR family transcriptional regulator [Myxococcales bacterium]|nr:MerR family transcriptional regulator [Myxococcales bacterium]
MGQGSGAPVVEIPDKEYFKIGEVARLVGVEPYVLRFWESEFRREIQPERSRTNQRVYRRRDVETFRKIKALRYDEKLQVRGARRRLRVESGEEPSPGLSRVADVMREGLEDLLRIVDEDEAGK